ncbi:MAG: hypothetical protein M3Q91_11720 [Acidobacteriota bacterium]|nr:hypothetical protein [Acidobacteriota bacterium]
MPRETNQFSVEVVKRTAVADRSQAVVFTDEQTKGIAVLLAAIECPRCQGLVDQTGVT